MLRNHGIVALLVASAFALGGCAGQAGRTATASTGASAPAPRSTVVRDANGKEIAVFREFEQNIPVKPSDIPESLKQAVVAAEDRRFYKHDVVKFQSLGPMNCHKIYTIWLLRRNSVTFVRFHSTLT